MQLTGITPEAEVCDTAHTVGKSDMWMSGEIHSEEEAQMHGKNNSWGCSRQLMRGILTRVTPD
eukprot:1952358-Amphidinium_carterae.1